MDLINDFSFRWRLYHTWRSDVARCQGPRSSNSDTQSGKSKTFPDVCVAVDLSEIKFTKEEEQDMCLFVTSNKWAL